MYYMVNTVTGETTGSPSAFTPPLMDEVLTPPLLDHARILVNTSRLTLPTQGHILNLVVFYDNIVAGKLGENDETR